MKRGTACTWKFISQNISGKRQFFSPQGQPSWTTAQAVKKKRRKREKEKPQAPGTGTTARTTELRHPSSHLGTHLGLTLGSSQHQAPPLCSGAAFPKMFIIPQWQPHHLPAKPRAIRACSSSLVKSRINEGSLRSGVGGSHAPQPRAGLLYDKITEPLRFCTPPLSNYLSTSASPACRASQPARSPAQFLPLLLPAHPVLQADCCLLTANGNYQCAGKAGRANIAAGGR